MNALGHATVGLTTVSGEFLLDLEDGAAVADSLCTASLRPTVPFLDGSSVADSFSSMDGIIPTVPMSGDSVAEFSVGFLRIVRFSWDAALLIDIADEPSYPLIVVSEAEEPVSTNTISFRPF